MQSRDTAATRGRYWRCAERRRRLVARVSCLLLTALVTVSAWSQAPPGSWASFAEGDYLSARNSTELAHASPTGYTVEGWFFVESMPEEGDRELVIAAPGAFAFFVGTMGRTLRLFDRLRVVDGGGDTGRKSAGMLSIDLATWIHFSLQFVPFSDDRVDLVDATHVLGSPVASYYGHRPFEWDDVRHTLNLGAWGSDIYVGGIAPHERESFEAMMRDWAPHDPTQVIRSATHVRVGPIRISNAVQYPVEKWDIFGGKPLAMVNFDPDVALEADEHTVALWRFEEGPDAPRYSDGSGTNPTGRAYSLYRNRNASLSVSPSNRDLTTWADVKGRYTIP